MKFLETKDGFSVNIEQIEAIERVDDFSSRIHTHFNSYTANFPYMTLLQILEREIAPEAKKERVLDKLETVLESTGHYAG